MKYRALFSSGAVVLILDYAILHVFILKRYVVVELIKKMKDKRGQIAGEIL